MMNAINNAAYTALCRDGIAAQGDLLIVRADKIGEVKDGWEVVTSAHGEHVVAHSETGHHHVLRAYSPPTGILAGMALQNPVLWRNPKAENPELRSIVDVPEGGLAEIAHLRSNHTHETHILPPGCWVLIRQQRPLDGAWSVVAD
tara:strand:- start:827 stop:1261 length:435 start_codon:yes stop_codon:yes gene_type:complete